MAAVVLCDADRATILKPHEAKRFNWGWPRTYSPEAAKAVEEYLKALREAAREAQEVFADKREAARALFHLSYPDGLLPDEASDDDTV